jgi:class 3 adenylate cyclase
VPVRLVAERFEGELRIGTGINSGFVIAGITKTTGDTILLTDPYF